MVNKPRQDGDQKTFNGSMGTSANAIPVNEFKSLKISDSNDSQDNLTFSLGTAPSGLSSVQQHIPSGLKSSSRQFGSAFNSSEGRPFSFKSFTRDSKFTQESTGVQQHMSPSLKSDSRQFGNAFNSSDTSEQRPFSLKSLTHGSKSSTASFVKSELVGKFIALPTTEMSMKDFEWRHLNEENVRDNVLFDLNDGFDTNVADYSKFWYSSVKHLFEFIMAKATDSTNLKEAVHGSEFVTNRGTLAYFAFRGTSTFEQRENDKPPKFDSLFILTKFEGVIFMNKITDDKMNKDEAKAERVNRKFYQSHKFIHKLTTKNSQDNLDFDKFGSSYDMHFGVFKAQVTNSTGSNLLCFISAKIDGQDKAGNFIEIREQFGLTQKYSWYEQEPRWYLNHKESLWMKASLANIDRFIVGMHDADKIVKRVGELCMSDMKNSKKQWKPEDCITFLMDTFKEAQKLLDTRPEGALLKLETFVNRKEPAMTWIEDDDREQYEFLPPEFVKRFSTPK